MRRGTGCAEPVPGTHRTSEPLCTKLTLSGGVGSVGGPGPLPACLLCLLSHWVMP